jgi:NADPH-dependent curcumin reductase CurA
VNPLPPGLPPEAALSVFGHIGMTPYFGVTDIGRPKAGETMVVSGAGGR